MSTTDDQIPRPARNRGIANQLQPATRVTLDRTTSPFTPDELLWEVIKDRTEAVTFGNYKAFVDDIDCRGHIFRGVEGYQALKTATRAWLQHEAGVWLGTGDLKDDDVRRDANKTLGKPLPDPSPDDQDEIDDLRADYLVDLRQSFLNELESDLKVLPYHKLIVD